jgi:hypothetical protein
MAVSPPLKKNILIHNKIFLINRNIPYDLAGLQIWYVADGYFTEQNNISLEVAIRHALVLLIQLI